VGVLKEVRIMLRTLRISRLKAAIPVFPILLLGGCTKYTIETTLNPNGSGVRNETMRVTENEDVQVTPTEFRELMFATDRSEWDSKFELDDGDTVRVFERQTRVRNLESWSNLNDQVRISGALPANARSSVGFVTLGDVQFRNRVRVTRGPGSDGSTFYTFEESFIWENGWDVIVELVVSELDRVLAVKYPKLTDHDRGEIVGFARARLWALVDDGFFQASGAEEERLLTVAVDRTTEHAAKVIRPRYPNEGEDAIRDVVHDLITLEDDDVERQFDGTVPGLNLGLNTNIIFRLKMPGIVDQSNADKVDGEFLVWEFDPTEALAYPVEISARSVVRSPQIPN
jgi:hypothetical protein